MRLHKSIKQSPNIFKQEKAWCVLSRIMPKTPNGSAVREGVVFKFWCGFGCGMPDLPIIKRTVCGHVTCAGRNEKIEQVKHEVFTVKDANLDVNKNTAYTT